MASSAMHTEEKTSNSRVFSVQHSSRFLHLCFQNFLLLIVQFGIVSYPGAEKYIDQNATEKPNGFYAMAERSTEKSQVYA